MLIAGDILFYLGEYYNMSAQSATVFLFNPYQSDKYDQAWNQSIKLQLMECCDYL